MNASNVANSSKERASNAKRKVVVTDMRTISTLSNDVQTLLENIMAGNSGIKQLNDAAFQNINPTLAGTAMPFRAEDYLRSKEIKRYDRFTQFGYAAAMQALEQSELDL